MSRAALGLGLLALGLGLALPLASLPPFALGQWDKAEPLVIGFHGVGALAALAVALALAAEPVRGLRRVAHPYVAAPLALGLWSAAVAPLTPLPLLSLFGAPQSGFGALWFLDAAALIACARLVARHRRSWRGLTLLALGLGLAVAALKAWDWWGLAHGDGGHLLIFVAAYYGWLGLALPLLARRHPGESHRLELALLAVALALALVSRSIAALALLLAGAITVVLVRSRPGLAAVLTPRLGAALVAIAALLPWSLLHLLPAVTRVESLRDRLLVSRVMQAALRADPAPLLGHGWGRTQDALRGWLTVAGERLWDPGWIFLKSDYFHSHDWAMEAVYAAGLPGLLLTLAGFLAIPLFARPSRRVEATAFGCALAALSGLWFPLCLSVPLLALALAALADDTAWLGRGAGPWPGRGIALAALGLALALGAAAVQLWQQGRALDAVRAGWQAQPPLALAPPADFRGSDLAAAEAIRDALARFARRARTEPTPPLAAAVGAMLAEIDRRAATTLTVPLLETGLTALAQIQVTGELGFAAAPGQAAMGRRWLDRLLVLAPGRGDLAIPTFSLLLAVGRGDAVLALADRLLAADPGDPVGLHFRGLALLLRQDPASAAEGFRLLRAALDRGIERFLPIDPAVKKRLGQP
ncbi:hypothetical protein [Phaeospirillum tilakii]|uniref:O-antigen ligase n=1 Tax=Phaeospirillum tilakii TaxID=741673 RepID=A0ABW5CDG0_9PROT